MSAGMGSNLKRCVLAAVLSSFALAACTTSQLKIPKPVSPYLSGDSVVVPDGSVIDLILCAQLFVDVESVLRTEKLHDVQTQRLAGFPYLRTDRHYASYRDDLRTHEQITFWAEQLRLMDLQARRHEIASLDSVAVPVVYGESVEESLAVCGEAMLAMDLVNQHRIEELLRVASVPDSYSNLARVLGVYPVSRWFVSSGVTRLQRGIQQRFEEDSHAARPDSVRYMPADNTVLDTDVVTDIFVSSRSNPLGIPMFSDAQKQQLFAHYSPVLDVQTLTDDDRLGSPFRTGSNTIVINTADPVVYHKLSYTRMHDKVFAQLNYIFWFPARPRQGMFDLLGGHIDGINLRITLDADGRPIMYDAMHNCGCYHMYFPAAGRMKPAMAAFDADEPLLVPKTIDVSAADRLLVQIDAVSHYITGVGSTERAQLLPSEQRPSVSYRMADYDELRSLRMPNGERRSLFGPDGLVPGSIRRERWVLWPMGVLEPGAMRQWGHHATAFVGRRHFDDPFLLQRYFVME